SGGRCMTVVGMGANILEANQKAYEAVEQIHFDGAWYRKDIGNKFFEN
ncbi:MAG: phosphoribosylglycinamide synthetase C domain-containing protein, partial [Sphaerochaetaceae bacterium]